MSASSTLPRTNTSSMSPSVMTSVAFAPRFRIEDTGLPSSTSRVSTVARMGALMVEFGKVFLRAFDGSAGFGDRRLRLGDTRAAHDQLSLRGALTVLRHLQRARRIVERGGGQQLLLVERLRAVEVAAGECHVRGLGLDRVLFQLRFGAGERRALRQQVRVELPHSRPELFLVELRQHIPGAPRPGRRRRSASR